jgi:autotransporter-associated beta strand protein
MLKQIIATLVVGGLATMSSTAAITSTWDGEAGTLNWGDAANWDPDGVPDNNGNTYDVVFDASLGSPILPGADRTIDTLDVNASVDFDTAVNHTITIAAGFIGHAGSVDDYYLNFDLPGDTEISVTDGRLQLRGELIGSSKLTKTGNSELRLFSDSTSFTGDVEIQDGKIFQNRPAAVGNSAGQTVTVRNGATFQHQFAGGTVSVGQIVLDSGGTFAIRGANVTSSVSGSGTIFSSSGAGTTLSGDNSAFTGDINISGGVLNINGLMGTSDISFSASGKTFGGDGTIIYALAGDSSDIITVSNGATWDIRDLNLDLDISGAQSMSEYVIGTYDGATLLGSEFASVNGLPSGWDIDYDGTAANPNSIVLFVPEPATMSLLALGLIAVRRRSSKRAA